MAMALLRIHLTNCIRVHSLLAAILVKIYSQQTVDLLIVFDAFSTRFLLLHPPLPRLPSTRAGSSYHTSAV